MTVFQGFSELIDQIRHLQILAEASNNDPFDPWYAMSYRIKQDALLLEHCKTNLNEVVLGHEIRKVV